MGNFNKGFPPVQQSITNANVLRENALDRNGPFSLIQFIKVIDFSYEPNIIQDYYNYYLKLWNSTSTSSSSSNEEIIVDNYRQFLKDIAINYSSNAERKFLSQLDFNNSNDLSTAVTFYSKKLRDIISHYKKKRRDLSIVNTKTKLRGTNIFHDKEIYKYIVDLLDNRQTGRVEYNIEDIKSKLSVSLTEYFDIYTDYYNLEPDSTIYGQNDLSFDDIPTKDLFLNNNQELIDSVFNNLTQAEINFKEIDSLLDTKRKLTEKYLGTDFYYISTNNNGEFIYDKLITAEYPSKNYLNQRYPTYVTSDSNLLSSKRNVGYFDSTNTGIAVIEAKPLQFFLKENYEPDSFYIFPDPNIFTNNEDILTFNIPKSQIIGNISNGVAKLQPTTSKENTPFIGYVSEFSNRDNSKDLSFLFDSGYISDAKYDLNGNLFGLLKDDFYHRSNIEKVETKTIKNLIFNGYQFFDTLFGEGYNFNYDTVDNSTYLETIRSGLSTFTNGFTGLSLSAYNMFFRFFYPYENLIEPTITDVDFVNDVVEYADVRDSAYFMFSDTEFMVDPISSDLSAFTDSTSQFYFTELFEGGVSEINGSTVVRALCDALYPAVTGDFTLNVRVSGNNGVEEYDGGKFTDKLYFNYTPSFENYYYDDTVINTTTTIVNSAFDSDIFKKITNTGTLYIKDTYNNVTGDLLTVLPNLSTKYTEGIIHALSNNIITFDLSYDTLFLQTSSYLVIEGLSYDSGFEISKSPGISISYYSNNYNKISNRFKINNKVYYTTTEILTTINPKEFAIYPVIYEYDYISRSNRQIFPTTNNSINSLSSIFVISGGDVLYTEVDTPVLTYSSENELFELSLLLKDQNKSPYLLTMQFDYTNTVNFYSIKHYRGVTGNETFIFNTLNVLSSFNFNLSSQPLASEENYLVL